MNKSEENQEITLLSEIPEEEQFSLDVLRRCVPANRKHLATQELVDKLNGMLGDDKLRENFRENLYGMARILKEPKYNMTDYVNAVRYCSYKALGDSNVQAYTKTFPERFQRLVDKGTSVEDINCYVRAYNKNLLVAAVTEQMLVPSWLLNQGLFQQALNVQADLMMNAKSEKVRTDAANSLLGHLKMPEVAKVELDVNVKEDDAISELRRSTLELVAQQRKMLEAGVMKVREAAEQKVVQGEIVSEE